MATEYPVELKLCLRPIGKPWVKIKIAQHQQTLQLTEYTEFVYNFTASDSATLAIEHFNKSNTDPTTSVEIAGIEFYGISDSRFAWAGTYTPNYPEPWASNQAIRPQKVLTAQTFLGWNGVYELTFSMPVFTWIHQIQNLGWIYT